MRCTQALESQDKFASIVSTFVFACITFCFASVTKSLWLSTGMSVWRKYAVLEFRNLSSNSARRVLVFKRSTKNLEHPGLQGCMQQPRNAMMCRCQIVEWRKYIRSFGCYSKHLCRRLGRYLTCILEHLEVKS